LLLAPAEPPLKKMPLLPVRTACTNSKPMTGIDARHLTHYSHSKTKLSSGPSRTLMQVLVTTEGACPGRSQVPSVGFLHMVGGAGTWCALRTAFQKINRAPWSNRRRVLVSCKLAGGRADPREGAKPQVAGS
jgi:hypothetical protein